MRAFPSLVLLGTVVVGSTCLPRPDPIEPSAACIEVLACYFNDDSLEAVPGFEGLFPGAGNQIVRETYGPGGTCWLEGAGDLADSCTDRCKGLLWQDCAHSYRRLCAGTETKCLVDADCGAGVTCVAQAVEDSDGDGVEDDEVPFCANACSLDNALRCRFEDFAVLESVGRVEDEPLFSACPVGTKCNAVPPDFEGPAAIPDQTPGCCQNVARNLLVDDRETCNQ